MDSVDDLSQETNKFFNYQRSLAKQQQAKQQYQQKRVNCLLTVCVCLGFYTSEKLEFHLNAFSGPEKS